MLDGLSRKRASNQALAALFLLTLAVGCTPKSEPAAQPATTTSEHPIEGGQVQIGLEVEPATLNPYLRAGDNPETVAIVGPILSQLATVKPNGTFVLDLLRKEPELLSQNPQRVGYALRDTAYLWDDRSPISAQDVQYTLDQILAPNNDIADRRGYSLIKNGKLSEVSPDGKSFVIEFTQPYAPWRSLFTAGEPILKKSAMDGQEFNAFLNEQIPFSSGPFKFEGWTKGSAIKLVKNENYWGNNRPHLDNVGFQFLGAPTAMVDALKSGSVDVVHQIGQPEIARSLKGLARTDIQVSSGPMWEHLDFNLRDSLLQLSEVRQAVVAAIDRVQIAETVLPAIGVTPSVLQNVFFMNNQSEYEQHWDSHVRDKQKVATLLESAGFVKGVDNIYARGSKRLSLTLATSQDTAIRKQIAELLEHELGELGIELRVDYLPSNTLFDRVANCEYQIALFAYRADLDPASANDVYRADAVTCPGKDQNVDGQNSTGYRNIEVTELLKRTDSQLDGPSRVRLYQDIDRLIAKDVPTLPLFQRSTVTGYASKLRNVVGNATKQGPTWNLADWWIKPE